MRGEPDKVKQLLRKAKDSALLAVEFYNKPSVSFKSEGFITMMCIAWTGLFHAYFFKNKIKPYWRKKGGTKKPHFEKITEKLPNGNKVEDYKWWELSKCIEEYFKNDPNNPVRKNLEFFSSIRNFIVHRNIPELDPNLYSECQANVLNFNEFLIKHFGQKHTINNMLSYTIQMSNDNKNFLEASKRELKKKNACQIVEFIKAFRSALSNNIFDSPKYAFKAVLIQVKNHESKDALAIKFINENNLSEEQKKMLKDLIVMFKDRNIIQDGVPDNFIFTYNKLKEKVKEEIPHIQNNYFEKLKKYLRIRPENKFALKRIHNPRSSKSQCTYFYDPKIIDEFKKYCPSNSTSQTLKQQIETRLNELFKDIKGDDNLQNPETRIKFEKCSKEIDSFVNQLNDLKINK